MSVSQQTWIELLLTPNSRVVQDTKYTNNEWLNELVHLVVIGSYDKLLTEYPDLQDLLSKDRTKKGWISTMAKLNNDEELLLLLRTLVGIAYLQLFIIDNFLGPKTSDNLEQSSSPTDVNENLTCDGEAPVPTGERLNYLFLACQIFNLDQQTTSSHWTHYWWTMRTLFIHQKLLQERSMTLCNHLQICIDKLLTYESEMNRTQKTLFFIEIAYISQFYYKWTQAEMAKNRALELTSLAIHLTGNHPSPVNITGCSILKGQLGKRTRFQINPTSQLLVDIVRNEENHPNQENESIENEISILPKDLSLNDDVLLNRIEYANGDEQQNSTLELNIVEQLTLLLIIHDRQVNNPRHEITTEEQLAFLTYILARPINWCVQTCSLVLRCRHETENKRKIERTLLQLQELIDQYDRSTPSSGLRLQYFHSSSMLPKWKLQSDIARIYVTLGLINNALDLYLHLKKWSDVITCYQLLKKLSLAEHVIREQLKIQETPELYCSLGEVTDEFEYFERAWTLSKGHNGRAQRLMGKYYFNRGNYDKACEHLEKAVEINSLQHDTWFWLGSAAFRTERWELGIRAYRRCTSIEPDNFEAWNNLAACHTKLKQTAKAHTVFLEAIKCNFDNWKVWENFLWTSVDCGELNDVIQAYHRLIDLKTKYVDKQVLQRLVDLLSKSEQNDIWMKIFQKSLELFGRLTAQVTNDADIWELYSDLCELKSNDINIEWHSKILQQLQRAHRCAVSQSIGWENEINPIIDVLTLSNKLAASTMEKLGQHPDDESFKQLCHSTRLSLNSVLTRLKQKYTTSLLTTDNRMTESIEQLEQSLSKLTAMLLH